MFKRYFFQTLIFSFLFILFQADVYGEVRLWVSSSTSDGNIGAGGRVGVDSLCDSDLNKPTISNSITRALISVDTADEIRNMPRNYGIPRTEAIYRADGVTRIADNFDGLIDSNTDLKNSVSETLSGVSAWVWAGSLANASLSDACAAWTHSGPVSTGVFGSFGNAAETGLGFLQFGATACLGVFPLYCITYIQSEEPDEFCTVINSSNGATFPICF